MSKPPFGSGLRRSDLIQRAERQSKVYQFKNPTPTEDRILWAMYGVAFLCGVAATAIYYLWRG